MYVSLGENTADCSVQERLWRSSTLEALVATIFADQGMRVQKKNSQRVFATVSHIAIGHL
jgi:hypothetical protein